jgi:hypothetical protein
MTEYIKYRHVNIHVKNEKLKYFYDYFNVEHLYKQELHQKANQSKQHV